MGRQRTTPVTRARERHLERLAALLAALLAGCSDGMPAVDGGMEAAADASNELGAMDASTDANVDAMPVAPLAYWVLPRGTPSVDFALPWPNDVTLASDGTIDLTYLPNPMGNAFVATLETELAHQIDGASTVGATYFHFSVPLDPATLPVDAATTLGAASSIQLVDVSPESPQFGQRMPVTWHFHGALPVGHYWPANTLAVLPVVGFPLHAHTTYALVVTNEVRAAGGGAIARDVDLDAVLAPGGGDADVATTRTLYAPALAELATLGLTSDRLLTTTVFTTQDPTRETYAAIDRVLADASPPAVLDLALTTSATVFHVYEGHYGPSPVFQVGTSPYTDDGSGGFLLDATGTPVQEDAITVRFALTVPTTPEPPGGYPLALYAHGSGGDYRSFIGDNTAGALAGEGVACMGIDQIFSGERTPPGTDPLTDFFNFTNPLAARTNNRQAAIDLAQQGRMARTLVVPASVSGTGADVHFDPTKIMFFGHSQGGLNGPLWLASDPLPIGAVLSGSGGTLNVTILEKRAPVDIPSLFATLVGVFPAREDLVPSHPVLTLAQTVLDVSDPINYVRALILEPRTGNPPRSIFQTEGFVDTYVPDDVIAGDAIATGLPLAAPILHPVRCCAADMTSVDDYGLAMRPAVALPVSGNFASGTVTGLWMQFDAPPGRDGHFVAFDVTGARLRAARFLGTLAATGLATVPATVP